MGSKKAVEQDTDDCVPQCKLTHVTSVRTWEITRQEKVILCSTGILGNSFYLNPHSLIVSCC